MAVNRGRNRCCCLQLNEVVWADSSETSGGNTGPNVTSFGNEGPIMSSGLITSFGNKGPNVSPLVFSSYYSVELIIDKIN